MKRAYKKITLTTVGGTINALQPIYLSILVQGGGFFLPLGMTDGTDLMLIFAPALIKLIKNETAVPYTCGFGCHPFLSMKLIK